MIVATLALLLSAISLSWAGFVSGRTNPEFVDSLKTGIASNEGGKQYDNCKVLYLKKKKMVIFPHFFFFLFFLFFFFSQFFTMPDAAGTLVKMYWSIVGQEVQISVSMEFKIFKQGGWFAVRCHGGCLKEKKKKKKKKKILSHTSLPLHIIDRYF
jgi:hypothetical protein